MTGRKRSAQDDVQPGGQRKYQKTNEKKKAKRAERSENFDMSIQINKTMRTMDGRLLADFMARQVKHFSPKISSMEMEELRVPEAAFSDKSQTFEDRTLEQLPEFIEHSTEKSRQQLMQAPSEKGCPHMLVLCPAGQRAADLVRALRPYQTKAITVAKLFAKHIKLKESIETVTKTKMNIGVGTPQRVIDLIDAGALKIEHLEHIVIDGSWCGLKKRTIFDIKEIALPLMKLLTRPDIKKRYQKDEDSDLKKLEIIVF
ncbi:MAG: hypothetical protein M1831_000717 [Alyxoria varia]|nr:MAG: hypothetical protein M1831_000717 [Alyxoria varia]